MSETDEGVGGSGEAVSEDAVVDRRMEELMGGAVAEKEEKEEEKEERKEEVSEEDAKEAKEAGRGSGFEGLGLVGGLLERVKEMGFTVPSDVQREAIPLALRGSDLVGISQTGSGKTAAFGLPLLQKLDMGKRVPQALVVCPTRELAVQVNEAITEFGKGMEGLRTAVLYGGAPIDRQIRDLDRGAQLVVGTPGRIQDHMRRQTLKLGEVRYVVLDEADRMLDMGFRDEVEELLEGTPGDRQSLFFSATMNPQVARLIERFAKEPAWVEVKQGVRSADTVEQGYYDLSWQSKPEVLYRILEKDAPALAIIFCNTKRVVDECSEALLTLGFPADKLHGDMAQAMRERVLRRFKEGEVTLLVATDVAGRGLDVDDVDLVINYDLPNDPEDYVHRIGRTGRAGRAGRAVTLVARREQGKLAAVRRYSGGKMQRLEIPTRKELEEARTRQLIEELRESLAAMGEGEKAHAAASGTALAALAEGGVEWRDIAGTLFDLWCGESMREIEAIPEDRPQRAGERDRGRDEGRGAGEGKRRERGGREEEGDRGREREGRGERAGGGEGGKGRPEWKERKEKKGKERGDRGVFKGEATFGARIFVGLGKAEQIKPGELIGMLYNESGAPDGVIGKLQLFSRHALMDVEESWAETIVKAGRRARFRGRAFRIRMEDDEE